MPSIDANFLKTNLQSITAVYESEFGSYTGMPNPRIENVNGCHLLISCHYDNYDDYDADCGDENHHGAVDCSVCHMKDSWDFTLTLCGELPGGLCIS